jgi:hypothetical protein
MDNNCYYSVQTINAEMNEWSERKALTGHGLSALALTIADNDLAAMLVQHCRSRLPTMKKPNTGRKQTMQFTGEPGRSQLSGTFLSPPVTLYLRKERHDFIEVTHMIDGFNTVAGLLINSSIDCLQHSNLEVRT